MCGTEIGRWWTTWSNCSIKWWYKTLSNSGTLEMDIRVARYFRGKLKGYWLTSLDGWLRTLWFAMSLTFSIFIWSLPSEEMKSTKSYFYVCWMPLIEFWETLCWGQWEISTVYQWYTNGLIYLYRPISKIFVLWPWYRPPNIWSLLA